MGLAAINPPPPLPSPDTMYRISEFYTNHGTADNFMKTITGGTGTATYDVPTHKMVLDTPIPAGADGRATYYSQKGWLTSPKYMIANFIAKDIVMTASLPTCVMYFGIAKLWNNSQADEAIVIWGDGYPNIYFKTVHGINETVTAIPNGVTNDDLVTIKVTDTYAELYVNGTLKVRHVTNVPALEAVGVGATVLNFNGSGVHMAMAIDYVQIEVFK